MKEMTNVASTVMTEEEKAELERDMKASHAQATGTPIATPIGSGGPPTPIVQEPTPVRPFSPLKSSTPVDGHFSPNTQPTVANSPVVSSSDASAVSPTGSPDPSKSHVAEGSSKKKGKQKLSPEQKKKLEELEKERRKAMEERVNMLTDKLIERIRPFVEAQHPGDEHDPETTAFQQKMQREADDLKFESFGVEVRSRRLQHDFTLKYFISAITNHRTRIHDKSYFVYEVA